MHGRLIGLPESFTVMDQGDSADLIDLVRLELGLGEAEATFPPRRTRSRPSIRRMVNAGTGLQGILESISRGASRRSKGSDPIFAGYVERKSEQGVLDYDDLLLFWGDDVPPSVGARIGELFDHVLVDEYQDTNALQARILSRHVHAAPQHHRRRDDAQSIYSFRGASFRNILDFPTQHPGTAIIPLERNYRSTRPILESSNAVIAEEPTKRHSKELLYSS